jgi:hypothetical protein
MFKQNLQSQGLIFADEGSFIHENVSFSDFMYRISLLESAVLDTANRTAYANNEHKIGVLTEAAVGESIKKGGEAIKDAIKKLGALIANFMTTIYDGLMNSTASKVAWLKANKAKLSNIKVPNGFKFRHNKNAFDPINTNMVSNLAQSIKSDAMASFDSFKQKVAEKMGMKSDTGEIAAMAAELKDKTLGEETDEVSQGDVHKAMSMIERGQSIIASFKSVLSSIKNAANPQIVSDSREGASEAMNKISACKWIIQLVRAAMNACSSAINQSYNFCKSLLSRGGDGDSTPTVEAEVVKEGGQ